MRRRNDLRSFHSATGKKIVLHNPRSNKREIVSEKELFSPSSHFTEGGALCALTNLTFVEIVRTLKN